MEWKTLLISICILLVVIPFISTFVYNGNIFQNVINVTKAEHLNSNRNFISDIYPAVKALDGNWSESINNDEYVRVTFQIPLDNKRDITLYSRVISGNPKIEVYKKNGQIKIAEFYSLNSNEFNRVFLDGSSGAGLPDNSNQRAFDLKIVGGSVQFDYIIDPDAQTISTTVTNYTSNSTFTAPANVNNITIEAWGGGGAGGSTVTGSNIGAGGGGGGQFVMSNLTVVPGTLYNITVAGTAVHNGTADVNGTQGQNSTFTFINGTVRILADGGNYGVKGSITGNRGGVGGTGGIGDLQYRGGNGSTNIGTGSGGGGGGAGSSGIGGNSTSTSGGTATNDFGGAGGAGSSTTAAGGNGTLYGSGGGGARKSAIGGNGTQGLVMITYVVPLWGNNATNGTQVGAYVLHSVNLTDDLGLSGYIFSFDNGSGTFTNNTFTTLTGTANWSNVTKWVNTTAGTTIRWYVWFNNTANNFNTTNIFTYTTIGYGYLNVSITAPSNNSGYINGNTNLTINATVSCVGTAGSVCGTVSATARYNLSANPDTAINTTTGATPFYITGGSGNSYCFQQSANTSNQPSNVNDSSNISAPLIPQDGNCGLNYSGSYNFTGGVWTNNFNIIDGNWSSFGTNSFPGGGTANMFFNYTLPSANISSNIQLLQIKSTNWTKNYSINPSICDTTGNQFKLMIGFWTPSTGANYSNSLFCKNATDYNLLTNIDFATPDNRIYEQAMWWNISGSASNPQTSPSPLSAGQSFYPNWTLKVTSASSANYLINVNFNSSYGNSLVQNNFTANETVILFGSTQCWTYNAGSKLLIIPAGCMYYQSAGTINGI